MTRNDAFRIWDAKVKHYNAGTLIPTVNGRGRLSQDAQDAVSMNFEDASTEAYFVLASDYAPKKRNRVGGCIAKHRVYTAQPVTLDRKVELALEAIKDALAAGTITPEIAQPLFAKIEAKLEQDEKDRTAKVLSSLTALADAI